MNRRDFLKSMAAFATATAVGPIVREMVAVGKMASPFVLHVDGITDDAPAIQALINGETVIDSRTGKEITWCKLS